jgi:hypothetical protein
MLNFDCESEQKLSIIKKKEKQSQRQGNEEGRQQPQ